MKKSLFLMALLAVIIISIVPAHAETILDDGFEDTTMVDLTKTTARVDTVNHCVLLPWQSLSSSISTLESGLGYAAASKDGITLYEYDDATGTMAVNPAYSCPWATDATGVSIRQDNLNLWAITSDSIAYYKFNGVGMSNDPALKTTGLVNVLSVAAFKTKDSALLLQNDGNKAKITKYDAGDSLNPALVFTPDITDPVSISMVNDSPDFRLFTKTSGYYFMYDDAGYRYIEDPARRITGLAGVLSASSDDTGSPVLTGNDLGYYINNDTGGASRVDVYSPGPVNNPVAVSLKPGTYEQVFIDESGNVHWWTYDDAANRMVRNAALEISGLNLNRGYAHPRDYYSKVINTTANDAVLLTVVEDKPVGTSIQYFVSSDGGANFTPVTPEVWTAVPGGNRFVVRAVLDTADPVQTPKILHISLEVDRAPDPPQLPVYGSCFLTSTPRLIWTFTDPDNPGDGQTAYQVQIVRASDMAAVLDSGKVDNQASQYDVPTSKVPDVPGPLWSSGVYQFKYRVKVWDRAGIDSPWSDYGDFCVIAFERPRIAQIVSPPAGQQAPVPGDPATHIIIVPGMSETELPRVKAGAKTVILVDTIGPLANFSASFPYLGLMSSVNIPDKLPDGVTNNPMYPTGNPVNRWAVEFWTDPSLDICPSGTVVQMQLTGAGPQGVTVMNTPPYADGVVVTRGSVYEDWFVVLHGRDTSFSK
ncbi:MAG: hypothetical protein ACOY40_05425 [Bacillota bacterium]